MRPTLSRSNLRLIWVEQEKTEIQYELCVDKISISLNRKMDKIPWNNFTCYN